MLKIYYIILYCNFEISLHFGLAFHVCVLVCMCAHFHVHVFIIYFIYIYIHICNVRKFLIAYMAYYMHVFIRLYTPICICICICIFIHALHVNQSTGSNRNIVPNLKCWTIGNLLRTLSTNIRVSPKCICICICICIYVFVLVI